MLWYTVCVTMIMHVIQSQVTNYSYNDLVQKQLKLVRWWILEPGATEAEELALPFTKEEEDIFVKFLDDHPTNFPSEKRELFESRSLTVPLLSLDDQESDMEKPCILLIRSKPADSSIKTCRRMDIVLLNEQLPVQLPFDIAGEIILEKV